MSSADAPAYAELHCLSNFSFLRGASHPEELVVQAAHLGYRALALTDECSVAGVVRAHVAARIHAIQLIIGSEFQLTDGTRLVILATSRRGYGALCALITHGRRMASKGAYCLSLSDLATGLPECLVLWLPDARPEQTIGAWFAEHFAGRAWLAVELFAAGRDQEQLQVLRGASQRLGLPMVACGDVHMHVRARRALQDTVTAVRLHTSLQDAGLALYANGERHLRSRQRLAGLYPRALLAESVRIAERCHFCLDELRYEYPRELVPEDETPVSHLRQLTEAGARQRWPEGMPLKVRALVERELALIHELSYEPYFLTVHDIVCFARARGILCQGRGSAANSAVCFCLGITEVDPARMSLLFERFISKERNEPPDIDVDFEHERREEVIQYIYAKYGRERAALVATVITYRARSAIRDVGKALGLDPLQVERLARAVRWQAGQEIDEVRIREAGFNPEAPLIRRLVALAGHLIGFPRHLSQHVGGFVIARGPLAALVPVENAAMAERTVIQWDKNDLEKLGLLKVDVLGLGMLSAIRRSFDLIADFYGQRWTLATVPSEDPEVYDMIARGDTFGVFQIESRAQIAMLPRLKPRSFYDLVIEVAIIRPGPIQGDMVHPYLRRRNGEEPVTYPSPEVQAVLERTLGVPIFQEQVMQLAVVAAGFTPGEADQLRRAMAVWRRRGSLGPFEARLVEGMRDRGYSDDFARQIFNQIKGFGEYGFPESHAASFALLVYVSAWLKRYYPAAFTCALINSQPMGFYAPSQLIQDARRHGVEVRPVDVSDSRADCTLEQGNDGEPVLRLGLRLVKGLSSQGAQRIVAARRLEAFVSTQDLAERATLGRVDLEALAAADALRGLAGHRHRAHWQVTGIEAPTPIMPRVHIPEALALLRAPREGQDIAADYHHLGLTLRRHPMSLLRPRLKRAGLLSAMELEVLADGTAVHTAGIVITKQRPGSASGTTFVTLEDETGYVNVILWRRLAEAQRTVLLGARLMAVRGQLQREDRVLHVIAKQLEDYTTLLGRLRVHPREFH